MERKWTKEQSEVINHRGGNLLVSAGAGAGKTAVLVERVLGRILEEKEPIGLDEFLVVTFTRAAAAEMKERIGIALEEKLKKEVEEDPTSPLVKRLMKQYALLPNAEISTIDSFCKTVVMEHFQQTDLDPSFRIADEVELKVLKEDLLEDFLEEKFEEGREGFLNLSEYFDRGKGDDKLGGIILNLCGIAESFPDREGWFGEERERLSREVFSGDGIAFFMEMFQKKVKSLKSLNQKAIRLATSPAGPRQYLPALKEDEFLMEKLLEMGDVPSLFHAFEKLSFATLGRGKAKDSSGKVIEVDEEIQEKVKKIRDSYKSVLTKKLKEKYFLQGIEEIRREHEEIKAVLSELLEISEEFYRAFSLEKRRKNLVDFSDLAHFALNLLVDEKGEPTEIAKEYRERFAEIMIDEYQDSNLIQDLLLSAISRERMGEPNLFMVGDVKQSIYGFRQAEPAIFLEKYHSYIGEGKKRKISLHKNFRSRVEVLETVNSVFEKAMREELGGLAYTEEEALVVGREDGKEVEAGKRTEILLFDSEAEEDEEKAGLSDRELEAYMIASRIKELKKEGYAFKDMTILLRSMSGWSEVFKSVLMADGIPVISETQSGYFSAWEVQVVLAYLMVLDNPMQDIPLTTILLSPIGGFQEEELAEMRIEAKEGEGVWESLRGEDTEKAKEFVLWILEKRRESVFTPVHEVIRKLYEETAFYEYVSGLPSGEVRSANLDMLIVKASEYEKTSLFGVNHFVTYIEKLKKYNQDFGEAEVADSADAVRIMSIHKSKGLEFPVVFVSGLAKGFNDLDAKKSVVFQKEIGLATDYFNLKTREEGKSFLKSLVADKTRLSNLSEEIRILYVALTRAREKLILTALVKEAEKLLQEMEEEWKDKEEEEIFVAVSESKSLLEIVLPPLLVKETESVEKPVIYSLKDLYIKEGKEREEKEEGAEKLEIKIQSEFSSGGERECFRLIEEELGYQYPYLEASFMKPSVTVSELKRLHLAEETEEPYFIKEQKKEEKKGEFERYIPEFERGIKEEEEELSGADKGTLIHKFFRKMDFKKEYGREDIKAALENLSDRGEVGSFLLDAIYYFTKSDLAGRMKKANERRELFRETPFTLGLPKKVADREELVMVQGMIDAWFLEDGEPVLLDYKTDRVKREEGEEILRNRYQIQFNYYKEAIERITGKKVKEAILYSLSLRKSIVMK